jgi:hypothetical protein
LTTARYFRLANFTDCVGGSENEGNDYSDVNSVVDVVCLYTSSSIINIQSNSPAIKFYYQGLDISFDCFLTGQCPNSFTVYVSANIGVDNAFCGGEAASSCKSIDYAYACRLNTNGTIYVARGEYPVSCGNAYTSDVVTEGIGYEDCTTDSDYPGLYPSNAGGLLNCSGDRQVLSLRFFAFVLPYHWF